MKFKRGHTRLKRVLSGLLSIFLVISFSRFGYSSVDPSQPEERTTPKIDMPIRSWPSSFDSTCLEMSSGCLEQAEIAWCYDIGTKECFEERFAFCEEGRRKSEWEARRERQREYAEDEAEFEEEFGDFEPSQSDEDYADSSTQENKPGGPATENDKNTANDQYSNLGHNEAEDGYDVNSDTEEEADHEDYVSCDWEDPESCSGNNSESGEDDRGDEETEDRDFETSLREAKEYLEEAQDAMYVEDGDLGVDLDEGLEEFDEVEDDDGGTSAASSSSTDQNDGHKTSIENLKEIIKIIEEALRIHSHMNIEPDNSDGDIGEGEPEIPLFSDDDSERENESEEGVEDESGEGEPEIPPPSDDDSGRENRDENNEDYEDSESSDYYDWSDENERDWENFVDHMESSGYLFPSERVARKDDLGDWESWDSYLKEWKESEFYRSDDDYDDYDIDACAYSAIYSCMNECREGNLFKRRSDDVDRDPLVSGCVASRECGANNRETISNRILENLDEKISHVNIGEACEIKGSKKLKRILNDAYEGEESSGITLRGWTDNDLEWTYKISEIYAWPRDWACATSAELRKPARFESGRMVCNSLNENSCGRLEYINGKFWEIIEIKWSKDYSDRFYNHEIFISSSGGSKACALKRYNKQMGLIEDNEQVEASCDSASTEWVPYIYDFNEIREKQKEGWLFVINKEIILDSHEKLDEQIVLESKGFRYLYDIRISGMQYEEEGMITKASIEYVGEQVDNSDKISWIYNNGPHFLSIDNVDLKGYGSPVGSSVQPLILKDNIMEGQIFPRNLWAISRNSFKNIADKFAVDLGSEVISYPETEDEIDEWMSETNKIFWNNTSETEDTAAYDSLMDNWYNQCLTEAAVFFCVKGSDDQLDESLSSCAAECCDEDQCNTQDCENIADNFINDRCRGIRYSYYDLITSISGLAQTGTHYGYSDSLSYNLIAGNRFKTEKAIKIGGRSVGNSIRNNKFIKRIGEDEVNNLVQSPLLKPNKVRVGGKDVQVVNNTPFSKGIEHYKLRLNIDKKAEIIDVFVAAAENYRIDATICEYGAVAWWQRSGIECDGYFSVNSYEGEKKVVDAYIPKFGFANLMRDCSYSWQNGDWRKDVVGTDIDQADRKGFMVMSDRAIESRLIRECYDRVVNNNNDWSLYPECEKELMGPATVHVDALDAKYRGCTNILYNASWPSLAECLDSECFINKENLNEKNAEDFETDFSGNEKNCIAQCYDSKEVKEYDEELHGEFGKCMEEYSALKEFVDARFDRYDNGCYYPPQYDAYDNGSFSLLIRAVHKIDNLLYGYTWPSQMNGVSSFTKVDIITVDQNQALEERDAYRDERDEELLQDLQNEFSEDDWDMVTSHCGQFLCEGESNNCMQDCTKRIGCNYLIIDLKKPELPSVCKEFVSNKCDNVRNMCEHKCSKKDVYNNEDGSIGSDGIDDDDNKVCIMNGNNSEDCIENGKNNPECVNICSEKLECRDGGTVENNNSRNNIWWEYVRYAKNECEKDYYSDLTAFDICTRVNSCLAWELQAKSLSHKPIVYNQADGQMHDMELECRNSVSKSDMNKYAFDKFKDMAGYDDVTTGSGSSDTVDPIECPNGQHEEDGICVEDDADGCDDGWHLEDGVCIKDVDPIECSEGWHPEDGVCVEDNHPIECSEEYHLEDDRCVPDGNEDKCEDGYHLEDDACVPDDETDCEDGEIDFDEECREVTTSAECGGNELLVDGVGCVAMSLVCGEDMWDGTSCVEVGCPSGYSLVDTECVKDTKGSGGCSLTTSSGSNHTNIISFLGLIFIIGIIRRRFSQASA